MNEMIFQAAALIVPLIVAIVFHEVAHGWTARALGDPTAAELKRLSLNPLRHIDPVGTILVPGALKLMGLPVFGWAKPVPVNKWRLRNPKHGMMLVAAAGPGMNLAMALVAAVLLGLLIPADLARLVSLQGLDLLLPALPQVTAIAVSILLIFITINIFLALFNLLPIPPFDGSHIVEGLLPEAAARRYAAMRSQGLILAIVVLVLLPQLIPAFDIIGWVVWPPVQWLSEQYIAVARAVAGG